MKRAMNPFSLVLLLFVLATIILIILGYSYFVNTVITEKSLIESNWGITIPNDYEEIFNKNTQSFHGDGARYTVYNTSRQNYFTSNFTSTKDKNLEVFVSEIKLNLAVPIEYQPDLRSGYTWIEYKGDNSNSKLVMLYNPGSTRLFVIQYLV